MNNYNDPSHHGFQYEQMTNIIHQNLSKKPTKMKKKTDFFSLFSRLNELVNVNECAYLCDNQQKTDTLQYLMARISPKMNVILRKDKTMMDLASYHHASLFSPVHSILEHAIKINQLMSCPGLTRDLIIKNYHRYLLRRKAISGKKKSFNQQKINLRITKKLRR